MRQSLLKTRKYASREALNTEHRGSRACCRREGRKEVSVYVFVRRTASESALPSDLSTLAFALQCRFYEPVHHPIHDYVEEERVGSINRIIEESALGKENVHDDVGTTCETSMFLNKQSKVERLKSDGHCRFRAG